MCSRRCESRTANRTRPRFRSTPLEACAAPDDPRGGTESQCGDASMSLLVVEPRIEAIAQSRSSDKVHRHAALTSRQPLSSLQFASECSLSIEI
jgi:hypothetical protein